MKSQEILQSISPALIEEIFTSIHAREKASYRSLVETLATRKKLRPIYLERKPRELSGGQRQRVA
ncbi:MAG: peptide ABC transporter ATP-binding protein, partial [Chthoniobacterales bacterium]